MEETKSLSIIVLAHDVSDTAIAKRVLMLRRGGAQVTVAGFRRTTAPVPEVSGCPVLDFGQTYNAGFVHRLFSVLRMVVVLPRYGELFAKADVIWARNLEMLALAVRGRALVKKGPLAIIYEVLDIHRLLLRKDMVGRLFRQVEGWLSRRAAALVTSSPAFIDFYFKELSCVRLPVNLVENKILATEENKTKITACPREIMGPPWIIGWFGILRCRQSLLLLRELVLQSKGLVHVVLRGRPAPDQLGDMDDLLSDVPGMVFAGAYKNPDDLKELYQGVHFTWAIDRFEEGLNSSWLLPNRLYEGGAFGAVPIAEERVETGRFLKNLGIGVDVPEQALPFLLAFFRGLTPQAYEAMEKAVSAVPQDVWVFEPDACKKLVAYVRSVREDRE